MATKTKLRPGKIEPAGDGAAVYVRVSSTGQLGRDGDDDGYSIPAQSGACNRKAAELGAPVLKTYIERAESARSDNRPMFQQMLSELPTLGVRYLIVHKIDRFARNRLDDALIHQQLREMGITLVSASEAIDDTPSGRLMHGLLASVSEFYSNNLATEVLKGLEQKAKTGGTPGRAPLGYLNVRQMVQGREIRTVVVDPDRAPLVVLAFDLYESGDWSIVGLTDYLNDLGLRTRETPGSPPKELGYSALHKMLRNRYYIGEVCYRGEVYEGRHEKLIDEETFERVQAVLDAHDRSGEHRMKRHHYLKGSLVCAHCGSRLIFGISRGRNGTQYSYFFCMRRVKHTGCDNRANLRAEDLEEAVEREYERLAQELQVRDIEGMRAAVGEHFSELRATTDKAASHQRRRIAKLEDKRRELLNLRYEKAIAIDLFREEQARLTREIQVAERLLETISDEFKETEDVLAEAINLAGGITGLYAQAAGDPELRRMMNQLFFKCIEVSIDGTVQAELSEPFESIKSGTIGDAVQEIVRAIKVLLGEQKTGHLFDGRFSNYIKMVGTAGLEPATSRV